MTHADQSVPRSTAAAQLAAGRVDREERPLDRDRRRLSKPRGWAAEEDEPTERYAAEDTDATTGCSENEYVDHAKTR